MIEGFTPQLKDHDKDVVYHFSESADEIFLDFLHVHSVARIRGLATDFLTQLCAYADERGKTVRLLAGDPFTWTQPELIEFYKRFGFVQRGRKTKDGCVPMRRNSRCL